MSHESPEAREHTRNIDLTEVADWHREPGTGLWSFGNELSSVRVDQDSATVPVDQETLALRVNVAQHETPTFFSGKFANVEGITLTEHGVQIQTSETDFFTYMASAYRHRDNVGQNPIRPLAVQATLFSPDRERMVIERRPASLADNPEKLSVFGGALKPNDEPNASILAILNRKLGLDLQPDQVKISGLVRENIDNIYCLTYSITLNEQQFVDGRERATAANRSGERMFYQVNTADTRKSIEQLFGGKRPIPEWDPNAYFNILYGLDAEKKRTPEELDEMVEQMKQYMSEHPMDYTYPIEKYLSPDLPNV
jgi:hypothetical protein